MYGQGQRVGIRWGCEDSPDGGMNMPSGFSYALYKDYHPNDECPHTIQLFFEGGNLRVQGEEWNFFDEEVFLVEEGELKIEDFV